MKWSGTLNKRKDWVAVVRGMIKGDEEEGHLHKVTKDSSYYKELAETIPTRDMVRDSSVV